MAAPGHYGTPLTRIVAPEGAPPKVPMAELAWWPRPILAHRSHASWPHRELHRRPQWRNSHGGPAPYWRTPHTL
eukprot:3675584-Pyramimonas_sp.AAC.1